MKFLVSIMFVLSCLTANAEEKTPHIVLTKDNVIVMNNVFEGQSVAEATAKAKELDSKIKSKDPLFLVISSPGGSIDAGIELIENLNSLNHKVHSITLFSASMGFQTVQGLNGKRLVVKNGTLMSHRPHGVMYGEFPGQLDSRYGYYLKRTQRLDKRVVERTNGKFTDKSYQERIANEMWCDGQDCVDAGFADKVVTVSCDQSLSGTHASSLDQFMYMGHVIEIVGTMANCPVITSPLKVNIFVDGQPLFANDVSTLIEPKKPDTKNDSVSYYSYRSDENVIKTLGSETAENIKRLVSEKVQTFEQNRLKIRYY